MNDPQPESAAPGGLGGGATISPALGARDTRLVERALKQRWPIPAEIRAMLGEELANIVTNREESTRARTAAARALLSADAINMEQEKRDAGGDILNVKLQGQVTQQHEHNIRVEVEQLCRDYDAMVARQRGVGPGDAAAPSEPVGAPATHGSANGLYGNGQHP